MNKHSLDAIFVPETVAVLGASAIKGKVGHDVFANILHGGYKGTLYPVNPHAKSILSVKCYPTLLDIPDAIDLAVIILSPIASLEAVKECAQKGVKGLIVISAGFKEVGGEGAVIEDQIKTICKEAKMRLVGPNCLGVINPDPAVSLNASFSARMPKFGNISFISQSGALCTSVLDFAADREVGFSKFISIGNKADVEVISLLQYYQQDPTTDVVMIYMEEFARTGREFIETVREITCGENPTLILAIKSGKTIAGAAAAASHTGALAGTDAAYDAMFTQSGIYRCSSVNELFDYATAFAAKKLPHGNRIAIVTNAGGPGILATDMTEKSGLKLATFSPETIEELEKHLPSTANTHNPVDVIGDASWKRYEDALATVISDRGVDGVLIILTPQSMTDAIGTAEAIVRIFKATMKPIVCCFMGIIDVSEGVKILHQNMVPVYTFPENAASALGALCQVDRWFNRKRLPQYELTYDTDRAKDLIAKYLDQGKSVLSEIEAGEILKCYGFNLIPTKIAKDEKGAIEIAEEIGYPIAMKIVSPQILHKSDAKAVKIGILDKDEVAAKFAQIIENAKKYDENATIYGVLIQKMADPGEEVILGLKKDPGLGHLVMFGLGGVFVELFRDVVFRIAPFGRNVARRMVKNIKGYPILKAFRGRALADIETIEKRLVSLSSMAIFHPEIKEMDINPLMVHEKGKGATIVDTVMTIERIDQNHKK